MHKIFGRLVFRISLIGIALLTLALLVQSRGR